MQTVCTHCGLKTHDGNVVCPRVECNIANLTNILSEGDYLSNIRIGPILQVLRMATIYRAERNGKPMLIKVAHLEDMETQRNESGYTGYLKREAEILQRLYQAGHLNGSIEALPKPLAPYSQPDATDDEQAPDINRDFHGRVMHKGQLIYYICFDDMKGRFLRDLLRDRPNPPVHYAVWIGEKLGEALRAMHKLNMAHGGLVPEGVLVYVDAQGRWRPRLLDFGLYQHLATTANQYSGAAYEMWLNRFINPAYTAPAIMQLRDQQPQYTPSSSTDVYGLSLLVYELLMGKPLYDYENMPAQTIRDSVYERRFAFEKRGDIPTDVQSLLERGLKEEVSLDKLIESWTSSFYKAMPDEDPEKPWYYIAPRYRRMALYLVAVVALMVLGVLLAPELSIAAQ